MTGAREMGGWRKEQEGKITVIWRSCEACGAPGPVTEVSLQSWKLRGGCCGVEKRYAPELLNVQNSSLLRGLRAKKLQDCSDP